MPLPTLLLLAVGLAMDAFAAAVTCGFAFRRREHISALRVALSFGLFQAGMPVAGWVVGLGVRSTIVAVDHWVAFVLLAAVGARTIWEAWCAAEAAPSGPPRAGTLLALSVATSIDAFVIGLTLSVLGVDIAYPAAVIGVVTFLLSFLGIVIGYESGNLLPRSSRRAVQALGGLVLLALGLHILVEHLATT
ncbi:MAG: manganese efflux pump [Acidobacteria bacterium]|nr:manganese efflux pump [Acidobacteriota bacterium]